MYRRLHAQLAPLILLPLLAGGCVQMTRHSNMMIFGTNTVVGVRAGTNATSVPEVAIGFTRQEAVILPLVANVGSTTGEGGTTTQTVTDAKGVKTETVTATGGRLNRLDPCDMTKPIPTPPTGSDTRPYRVNPCSLVAVNGDAQDSYSVLASFGGHFDASSETGSTTGKAGVAQYFATGMAAQLLALNGGAAVVAAGDAAKASGLNEPKTLSDLSPTAANRAIAAATVMAYSPLRAALAGKVGITAQPDLTTKFGTFEGAIGGVTQNIMSQCSAPADCADEVRNGIYTNNYVADPAKFEAAVKAW